MDYVETRLSLLYTHHKTNSDPLSPRLLQEFSKLYKDYFQRTSNSNSKTTSELFKKDFNTYSRIHQVWLKSTSKTSSKLNKHYISKGLQTVIQRLIQNFLIGLQDIFKATQRPLYGYLTTYLPTYLPTFFLSLALLSSSLFCLFSESC